MNLQDRFDTLASCLTVDLSQVRIECRDWMVGASLTGRTFRNISPAIDHDVLDAMLMLVPVAQVVVYQDMSGTYEVFAGHNVIETALHFSEDFEAHTPRWLVRRIAATNIKVVVFGPTVPREDAVFLARKFYNADVE